MSADIIYEDILTKLKKRLAHCTLEEEQRFVREAFDELWRRVLEHSRETSYSYTYNNIYFIFMEEVEKIRRHGKLSLGTSLVTCPQERSPRFNNNILCLEYRMWEIFHNQVRSEDREAKSTVLLMCVEFTDGKWTCRVEVNGYNSHAEINALTFIERTTFTPKNIHMYISRSPCIQCLPEIQNFIYKYQNTIETFRIRFSSVHKHYDSQQMKCLWKLDADIGVFTDNDWNHLEKHLTDDAYYQLMRKFGKMSGDQRGGATSEIEDNTETDNYDDDSNNKNYWHDENLIQYEMEEDSKDEVFTAVDSRRISENNGYDIYTERIRKIHPINYYYYQGRL